MKGIKWGLLFILYCSQMSIGWSQIVGVAARVNGVEITNFRLDRHFADYLLSQGRSVGAIRSPSVYKRFKNEALEQLIDKELLWQEAQQRGLKVDPARVQAELQKIKSAFSSAESFARRLDKDGFDESGYVDYLEQELAAMMVLESLTRVFSPSEEEVNRLYQLNLRLFERPEQLQARHILLKVDAGADSETDAAVHQQLTSLQQQLSQGADFAALARSYSQDSSAEQGGLLDDFQRGDMVLPFETAAFALVPGDVSEPVRTQYGWHLIKLEQHKPAVSMPAQQAKELIRQQLATQQQAEARDDALARLRADSEIEVLSR
ncbi:parvulin-like peptidyl-prolyl isomerase [Oceanisphaera litoralis]|uniref:peptidylprolyl isomerase n=1 Tax=Oceanisphaera litoralis TaxID=225144 RepID=UPI00195803A3|nr:peptidylprolyl isomerase [Oceanisphaera litoralis]MBM7455964.1 parvulin-like peptidyl-prolyl isomerase [Oceanisphaera litoralis]